MGQLGCPQTAADVSTLVHPCVFLLHMAVIMGTDRGVGNQGNAKTQGKRVGPGFGFSLHPEQR